ncbi:MAG: hypothetical protein JHC69_10745 [Akkermansiaceae bacterium]|nr:hypothetical protein [Akkermansiaceae bacterium]
MKRFTIKTKLIYLLATLCSTAPTLLAVEPTAAGKAPDYQAMKAEVEALGNLTDAPKYQAVERGDATPNLKPILYAGPNYQGKPTNITTK